MRLKDKVAIVTGAAKGNGQAIALGFANEGAKIAIIDIDIKGADETVHKIKDLGAEAMAMQGDITSCGDVDQLIASTMEQFGHIDILVNNAGVLSRTPFLELSENE